ncbi:hypothetical protein JCM10908_006519 [Rhodotorula pacifica]|uniref:Sgd1p n=1 Tax=Rhodotorula pacifica TaxID=1495444 RepID=UPI00318193D9
MPPQQRPYNHAARKRTATLPKSIRQELEQLGHIEPQQAGKGRLGRKDRRKAERNAPKQHRAQSQNAKKRGADSQDPPAPGPVASQQPVASTSKAPATKSTKAQDDAPPAKKRARTADSAHEASAAVPPSPPPPARKQTALEKLAAKQERGGGPDPTRKRNRNETDEDKEIAWLEAKLGVPGGISRAEKGKMKAEYDEDGLGDLFEGLDDLEGAAFGATKKNYAKLLREMDADDLPSDFDLEELEGASGSEDASAGEEDDDHEAFGEYGISDDELIDPSDDDDHEEMGELGSAKSDEDEMGILNESDFEDALGSDSEEQDGESDEEGEEEGESDDAEEDDDDDEGAAPPAVTTSLVKPATGSYVPPHLRKKAADTAATPGIAPGPTTAEKPAPASTALDAPPEDPRLRRQINGQLNKLSTSNMSAIVDQLLSIYSSNPRAVVSTTMISLLLGIVSDRDNLGDQLVVSYAALVAALFRTVGIEFPAGVVARSVELFDASFKKHTDAVASGTSNADNDEEGFEGRPGSKECLNLVSFISELYNFQVIHCGIVYDFVRLLIESGLGELEVELLSRIVKRSGQQLRSDDPSALKDIIALVKQKMQGVDPQTMNSRTRFMVEQLTNLRNNKLKQPGADGSLDLYTGPRKYLVGLNKRRATGAAPEPLRVTLSEIRSSTTRGKWWLVGAAWAGDPLAEETETSGQALQFQTKEAQGDKQLAKLARAQGMNTDVRKGIFNVIMTSEDYVDACDRLLQLGLSDVQQREIARVLLQCCGNEKVYNPYYTLVAHRLCTKSHSSQITLQYLLWDFFRDLGEKSVGGEELVKSMQDSRDGGSGSNVSSRRLANLAKLYAWCISKDALSLAILKPVPFASMQEQTSSFLVQLFVFCIIATQTPSPALVLPTVATRKDREAVERVFVKAATAPKLQRGLGYFLEAHGKEVVQWAGKKLGEREKGVVKWGVRIAAETLSIDGIVDL